MTTIKKLYIKMKTIKKLYTKMKTIKTNCTSKWQQLKKTVHQNDNN